MRTNRSLAQNDQSAPVFLSKTFPKSFYEGITSFHALVILGIVLAIVFQRNALQQQKDHWPLQQIGACHEY